MINKPTPFKGLNIRIPIIIPIMERGFINHGPTLCPSFPGPMPGKSRKSLGFRRSRVGLLACLLMLTGDATMFDLLSRLWQPRKGPSIIPYQPYTLNPKLFFLYTSRL